MKYLRMDALLIRADMECLNSKTNNKFSCNIVEKYNKVISLVHHKEYFEAMTKDTYPDCSITNMTIRVSQNDEYGKLIIDLSDKNPGTPLWDVVYTDQILQY